MKIINIENENSWCANRYLVFDENTLEGAVIDPGTFDETLKNEIEKQNVRVTKILLTHGHFDHILGVKALKEYCGAQVLIHADDAACLEDAEKSLLTHFGYPLSAQPKCSADVLLRDKDVLSIGENEFYVMHTPGHSPGSCCYVCEKERAIFSGDTLFCMTVGRTDFEGGDSNLLYESVKKLISLEGDYDIYPGHNISTTLERERHRNIFIRRMGR